MIIQLFFTFLECNNDTGTAESLIETCRQARYPYWYHTAIPVSIAMDTGMDMDYGKVGKDTVIARLCT
jgi:hypothetical protein